ncbi:MAG: cupin domain-containing protein, partial [Bryobacteraceae bacterium]
QGHVHRVSPFSGWSTTEIFEIWQGRALIYMQERLDNEPGRCFAVDARPGDRVIVPPVWAHAVISADARKPLVFGAWCDRDYGFVYDGVRARGGLAWFPLLGNGGIAWSANPRYHPGELIVRPARKYAELALDASIPLYDHVERKPEAIQWVSRPDLLRDVWPRFEP